MNKIQDVNKLWKQTREDIRERVKVTVGKHSVLGKPNDLIMDNFGTWLAGFMKPLSVTWPTLVMTDINNSVRTLYPYGYSDVNKYFNYGSAALGTLIRIGSGSTGAARTNYDIETPFVTSPESTYFNTGTASYALGYISFSGTITAGGDGTIQETGFYTKWHDSTGTAKTFLIFHDILTSPISFTAGQTVTASYSISI